MNSEISLAARWRRGSSSDEKVGSQISFVAFFWTEAQRWHLLREAASMCGNSSRDWALYERHSECEELKRKRRMFLNFLKTIIFCLEQFNLKRDGLDLVFESRFLVNTNDASITFSTNSTKEEWWEHIFSYSIFWNNDNWREYEGVGWGTKNRR